MNRCDLKFGWLESFNGGVGSVVGSVVAGWSVDSMVVGWLIPWWLVGLFQKRERERKEDREEEE